MMQDASYAKAVQTLAQRRQKAETAAIQANEQALAAVPQLRDVRQKKKEAGLLAGMMALQGAEQNELDEVLAQVRAYGAQESELLRSAGLDEAALTPHYTCPLCNDTGRSDGHMCQCLRELLQCKRAELVNAAFPFPEYRFEDFDVRLYSDAALPEAGGKSARAQMTAVYDFCRSYAQSFDMDNGSLFLYGRAGVGKTHLALSIAGEVRAKGYVVVYAGAQNVFAAMEKEKYADGQTLNTLREAQLLVLDDLGTEYITPYVASCLYELVNTRCAQHLPTIYTSNIVNAQDLARRYTEKVASRLLGECDRLYCVGEDMRLNKK